MSKPSGKNVPAIGAPEVDTLEQEEFLARWSKRKALAREGVELPEPDNDVAQDDEPEAGDADETAAAPHQGADGQGEDAPAAVPELPPIESLGEDSDYAPFLAAGVPADVQRKALRKLFRSPKFNVRDGLNDYDLDYSSPEPLGNIVTAEMRHRLRQELERLAGLDRDNEDEDEHRNKDVAAVAAADDSEEHEQPADSEPDDDEPATA
jgi:hypothetical protein